MALTPPPWGYWRWPVLDGTSKPTQPISTFMCGGSLSHPVPKSNPLTFRETACKLTLFEQFRPMTTPDAKELGKQLASLRKAQGLSQADLANASGLPITAIRRCEQNGRIPLDRYLKLASVLNTGLIIVPSPISTPEIEKSPNLIPYKSIEDVINSAKKHSPSDSKTYEIRKPRLGGLFAKINQSSPA
jgi:transcriptional regulator with XRE-family HTH domain